MLIQVKCVVISPGNLNHSQAPSSSFEARIVQEGNWSPEQKISNVNIPKSQLSMPNVSYVFF